MRAPAVALLLLLLSAHPLLAGERAVRGSESLLGDVSLDAIAERYSWSNTSRMVTDGDEVLLVWTGRSSLYGQRLDRFGAVATALPVLLKAGDRQLAPVTLQKVLFVDGLYTIFFARPNAGTPATWVMRLTRDLEIIDERLVVNAFAVDVMHTGEEYVLVTAQNVWRMSEDLSVIEVLPNFDGSLLVASPHGTLLIAPSSPAITARKLDDSMSVRIASADRVTAMQAMWTGSHYLLVWTDCPYGSCTTRLLTLDENLVARAAPVTLDMGGCLWCVVGLARLANDDVFVTWQRGDNTRGKRVRGGVPDEGPPIYLGDFVRIFYSPHGSLLMVNAKLNVRSFVPGAVSGPSDLPVIATPRAAAEETAVAVAGSPNEAAVARRRNDGRHVVSILDRDARTLRDVPLSRGDAVALSHDGKDFYALVSDSLNSYFQKVEPGAPIVKLPFRADAALIWTGSGFFILQSNFSDFTGRTQHRSRFLWLTREGKVEPPPCANWDFPSSASEPPVAVSTAEETVVAVGFHIARIREQCQTAPPDKSQLPYVWRAAWQGGTWAWPLPAGGRVELATSADPLAAPSLHRSVRASPMDGALDIAPIGGRWLIAANDWGIVRAAVHEREGALIGTSELAAGVDGRPFLVPVADRVLLVYRRQVYEPPYLGVQRVVAAPVMLETDFRRRTARP